MNKENNNSDNFQKILKISDLNEIPQNYTGIIEYPNSSKLWFFNGELHRIDGPAVERADGDKAWYLKDIPVSPLFFEIPDCEKYVDYYMTILQTDLKEHEEFLLKELKKQVESGIKINGMK